MTAGLAWQAEVAELPMVQPDIFGTVYLHFGGRSKQEHGPDLGSRTRISWSFWRYPQKGMAEEDPFRSTSSTILWRP
jgi:hypothetical protein